MNFLRASSDVSAKLSVIAPPLLAQSCHAPSAPSIRGASSVRALICATEGRQLRSDPRFRRFTFMAHASTPNPNNKLSAETSPYLLQHKDNPVDWWPWGEEALAEAKRTNRPILLSVGY